MESFEVLHNLVLAIEEMHAHSVMIPNPIKRGGYNLACLHIMKIISEHPDYRTPSQVQEREKLPEPEGG
jgi:hypothetical protein